MVVSIAWCWVAMFKTETLKIRSYSTSTKLRYIDNFTETQRNALQLEFKWMQYRNAVLGVFARPTLILCVRISVRNLNFRIKNLDGQPDIVTWLSVTDYIYPMAMPKLEVEASLLYCQTSSMISINSIRSFNSKCLFRFCVCEFCTIMYIANIHRLLCLSYYRIW